VITNDTDECKSIQIPTSAMAWTICDQESAANNGTPKSKPRGTSPARPTRPHGHAFWSPACGVVQAHYGHELRPSIEIYGPQHLTEKRTRAQLTRAKRAGFPTGVTWLTQLLQTP
jgi:hypothetical protein